MKKKVCYNVQSKTHTLKLEYNHQSLSLKTQSTQHNVLEVCSLYYRLYSYYDFRATRNISMTCNQTLSAVPGISAEKIQFLSDMTALIYWMCTVCFQSNAHRSEKTLWHKSTTAETPWLPRVNMETIFIHDRRFVSAPSPCVCVRAHNVLNILIVFEVKWAMAA